MRLFGLVWEWYVIVWASLGFVWALEVPSIQWRRRQNSSATVDLPKEFSKPLITMMFELSAAEGFTAWSLSL
jgi:hypothetical protein